MCVYITHIDIEHITREQTNDEMYTQVEIDDGAKLIYQLKKKFFLHIQIVVFILHNVFQYKIIIIYPYMYYLII